MDIRVETNIERILLTGIASPLVAPGVDPEAVKESISELRNVAADMEHEARQYGGPPGWEARVKANLAAAETLERVLRYVAMSMDLALSAQKEAVATAVAEGQVDPAAGASQVQDLEAQRRSVVAQFWPDKAEEGGDHE